MHRIILVDDEQLILQEMADALRANTWDVDAFSNPQEALEALTKDSYDLAILDIKMPGMSGVELLQKVKAFCSDMDIIFITGHPELATAIDAVQLGALDYLQRPFRNRHLVQAVRRAFAQRSLRLENAAL